MQYLRSAVFSISMILSAIVISTLSVLLLALPYSVRYNVIRQYGEFNIWVLRVVCKLDYEVEGRQNIPAGAGIIFSKHQSTWETMVLQKIFPTQCYVIKRELLRIPFFGWGLAAMAPIAIDRASGKKAIQQIVEQGIDRLKRGIWVVIFPEGTRGRPGQKTRYKVGGAILAAESGYPVVPVAHNSGSFWPKGQFLKKPGTVKIVIGPVIETKDRKPEEILADAKNWIEAKMQEIQPIED